MSWTSLVCRTSSTWEWGSGLGTCAVGDVDKGLPRRPQRSAFARDQPAEEAQAPVLTCCLTLTGALYGRSAP